MGDIQKLAGSAKTINISFDKCDALWRQYRGPHRKPLKLQGFDLKVRFDCSIARVLNAGGWLKLRARGLVGLGLAGLTSTMVAALHGGSEKLLAGFDALSGVSHARAPEESANFYQDLC